MSPILGIWASAKQGSLISSFDSIATTTVGAGGTSTITFNSIPSTYTHLQIRANYVSSLSGTGIEIFFITFNGDTTSNYSGHYISVNGSTNPLSPTISSGARTSAASTYGPAIIVPSTGVASGIIDILDYTSTNKNKTIRVLTGGEANTLGGTVGLYSGLWYKTPEAISSITLTTSAGNVNQYSSFALYGIKG